MIFSGPGGYFEAGFGSDMRFRHSIFVSKLDLKMDSNLKLWTGVGFKNSKLKNTSKRVICDITDPPSRTSPSPAPHSPRFVTFGESPDARFFLVMLDLSNAGRRTFALRRRDGRFLQKLIFPILAVKNSFRYSGRISNFFLN